MHKKLLNGDLISSNLNQWIDNIFGINQFPPEKLRKNSFNIFNKYIFYIDENNIYHRGNCYYIYISVKFAYYVIMIVRAFISAIKTKIKAERIIFISF